MRVSFGGVFYQTPFTREALKGTPKSAFRLNGVDYWATYKDKHTLDNARQTLRDIKAQKRETLENGTTINVLDALKPDKEDFSYRRVVEALAKKVKGKTSGQKAKTNITSLKPLPGPGSQSDPENH